MATKRSRMVVDRVSKPFFKTKPTGMRQGLSIRQSIDESDHGWILVLPGHGTDSVSKVVLPAIFSEVSHAK